MTKEEAIKILRHWGSNTPATDRDCAVKMAIEALEKPEPHWIPVTEDTLPEEGRIVVVYGEKGTWDYGKYRGYGPNIHYWYWKNKTFKKVYWWMYKEDALPEPYKGVTE